MQAKYIISCASGIFIDVGPGYHLAITKHPTCNVEDVTGLIQSYAQTACLESWVGAELSYTIHFSHAHSFPNLFNALEKWKKGLKIQDCVVTGTTMEEVFTRWVPITCKCIYMNQMQTYRTQNTPSFENDW